ncbi:MAG TPA: PHP domain-containing protein [Candidatus Limnocylindrales bacterium]|nr:PHP domain-containing protein [Candidatus Limnocylindrales bacterium]
MTIQYAELHAHTNFSFLDGASPPDELVERAVALGLTGLAVTDRNGLYGSVRFMSAAEEAGLHGVVGAELDLLDPAVPDPTGVVVPARRRPRRRRGEPAAPETLVLEGRPARPRPERAKLPGHRDPVKEDLRGIGERARGPHLVLLARTSLGWRSLCRIISRANLAGTKAMPRIHHALLGEDREGIIALSGCRDGEIARRLRVGDRAGARAAAERYASIFGRGDGPSSSGFFIELSHHLLPDDDWLVAESAALAAELGLPVVVTNDVHYATPDDREFHDILTAIRHGRTLDTLGDLRRPDAESYLKSGEQLVALADGFDPATAEAWREGIATTVEVAASCDVDLGFEQYRFPGFPVPGGETPFSYLSELCWAGARNRYHPLTSAVVKRLAHELDVIERAGLAEFFLICWDLMRFAKERGIPAQGRGSATSSIVSYTLGISRVEPIAHSLLFERFINPGRTTYPDVDIDFSSERREEVIQYVYERYGPEHTGMVCNLVTYRARSAVREVGYALGFPRPLVDRVAKALETYDSVMVRRDLEADGGFAEFFRRTGEGLPGEARAAEEAEAHGLVDRMGQLNTRIPLVGKVPPWRQPPKPEDPDAERPFAWLREATTGGGTISEAPADPLADPLAPIASAILTPAEESGLQGSQASPGRGHHAQERPVGTPSDSRTPDSYGGGRNGADNGPIPFREDRLAPVTTIRGGGHSDDEGGPGDSPASVAWLRAGRGTGYAAAPSPGARAIPVDEESGMPLPPPRKTDRLGRPSMWDPPSPLPQSMGRGGDRAHHNSVARIEPEAPPQARGGSTVGLSHWERWLEFCARIDGFPRHLSIHSGGMLVTAAPLIDIAPIERATMPDRVVVQFDKRDVETLKLIKLDLLGLGMLAAIDETLQLIEHDCAVCLDLDRLPEEVPEVFDMLQAADTVGVFQVESRAQMQTLPKSRPGSLDDLVVEVAIIRPGPIQGNAVHPYLRRKQGLEPVAYLHPSLEPVLKDTLGVILYQEQVMRIAIEVAGFSPAESDGFRRAMGTWRSTREMEKLHRRFVEGALRQPGMEEDVAEELFRQVAAFASFGFAKSHAAAFARTAYESSFLKLFYPAQFLVGLINAQPMGFYPVEVLVNDTKRHGVAVLPVDINASTYKTTTEWVGPDAQPDPVVSSACIVPSAAARAHWTPATTAGWGVRLGLSLVKGIGEQHEALLDAELTRGPYRSLADVVERTGLPEEVLERLIRSGAMDSLGRPRRELLWQLREVAGASRGRGFRFARPARRVASAASVRAAGKRGAAAGRPLDLRLPATDAPPLPEITESERIGDAYAVIGLDARRQVVGLFRGALDRLGAETNASLADRRPGEVRVGGLVVTRQHPMTAKGTVFLALEDETGMVNVTLWPSVWERLRGVVRRHALLLVDGELQREGQVVNLVAREIRPLSEVAATAGGPDQPGGVRQLGHAGMRRLG